MNSQKNIKLSFCDSITKKKEEFKPKSNVINWYICGPTVYDSSHIGHARTYICFDAIRRVLEDYFGYDVNYVMNVTDVDDKIINKAKEELDKIKNFNKAKEESDKPKNFNKAKEESDKPKNLNKAKEESDKPKNLNKAKEESDKPKNLNKAKEESDEIKNLNKAKEELDKLKNLKVEEINKIKNDDAKVNVSADKNSNNESEDELESFVLKCSEITKKYEKSFFDDLKELHVKAPTFVTRVTEYMTVIEDFIKDLLEKQLAYEANGSVYFDIEKYREIFDYPIFVDKTAIKPEETTESNENSSNKINKSVEEKSNTSKTTKPVNDKSQETNPDFSDLHRSLYKISINSDSNEKKSTVVTEKKNNYDFVLWKYRNKDFYYKSKFGNGRPGWHIECSAMANNIFPDGLDIHSGGIDLTFPHHENEIAQSQAKTNKKWVNTWIHTGHLHIDGLKMSKSLKNFITIKDFLSEYTPRQIRMLFLSHKWWLPMTFSVDAMQNAIITDNRIYTFISVVDSKLKESYVKNVCFDEKDTIAHAYLNNIKEKVHFSLCDNVDTSSTIKHILELISYYYLHENNLNIAIVHEISLFSNKILNILGFTSNLKETESDKSAQILEILNDYRNDIRDLCRKKSDFKAFFGASDIVREKLKELGYLLEDTSGKSKIRKST